MAHCVDNILTLVMSDLMYIAHKIMCPINPRCMVTFHSKTFPS